MLVNNKVQDANPSLFQKLMLFLKYHACLISCKFWNFSDHLAVHSVPFSNEKFRVQNFKVIPLNGRIGPSSSALDSHSIFIPQIYAPGAILGAGQSQLFSPELAFIINSVRGSVLYPALTHSILTAVLGYILIPFDRNKKLK